MAGWKLRFADPVLLILMGMRSLESVVIPMLIANRVAQEMGIANYSHVESVPCPLTDNNTQSSFASDQDRVQSKASHWAMAYWLASSLPGAVTAVLIGGWSDRIGRRTPMILAEVGYAVEAMFAMATDHWSLPLPWLIVGSAIEGVCGSYPTVLMAVYSYTSDISVEGSRTSRLLRLSTLEYLGIGACQLLGGYMLKSHGTFATMGIVLGGHVLAIFYATVLLADSRGKHAENVLEEGHASLQATVSCKSESGDPVNAKDNTHSYLYSVLKTFRLLLRPWPRRRQLVILLFSFELLVMNFLGISDISVLYVEHHPLCWPATMLGYNNAARYGVLILCLLVAAPLILHFQPPDRYVVQVATLGLVGYFATMAFATKTYDMFLASVSMVVAAPCIGTLRSMMSKLVPSVDHGAVFATIASLETIVTVLATVIYNNLYGYVIDLEKISFLPNNGSICFLLAAGLNLLPIAILGFVPARPTPAAGYQEIPGS